MLWEPSKVFHKKENPINIWSRSYFCKTFETGSVLAYLSYFPRSRWRWTVSSECLSDGLRCERSQSRALVTSEPEPEPGPNSDHRSRGWNTVTERREWERRWGVRTGCSPQREAGHRCPVHWPGPLYTEHKTWLSEPEKGNFTESSAQTKMIGFLYYLNIECLIDMTWIWQSVSDWLAWKVTFCWFDCELIVILMSETSGQGPTGSLPFLFWSCQKCQRRQTLNDNDTNFINIVKISFRNTWDIADNYLRKEIILFSFNSSQLIAKTSLHFFTILHQLLSFNCSYTNNLLICDTVPWQSWTDQPVSAKLGSVHLISYRESCWASHSI